MLPPLVRICVGATLLTTITNAVWLKSTHQGARLVETGYFALRPLLEKAGARGLFHQLPDWMQQFRNLDNWSDLGAFVPLALLANLPVSALVGALFCAVAALALRLLPRRLPLESRSILSAGLTALMLGPVALLPAGDWLYGMLSDATLTGLLAWSTLYALAVAVGFVLAGWSALLLLVRFHPNVLDYVVSKAGMAIGALVIVVWLAGWAMEPTRVFPADGPNVLLISIDSLRADHLHCYGYPRDTSPNLDRLAREGVRFQTVVAPSPWTLPSHMSLLTGLDSLHHGVVSDYFRLPPETPTLASVLRSASYATAGFTVSTYVSARWGFSRGFDFYHDYGSGQARGEAGGSSPGLVGNTRQWLDRWNERERERPFFVFLHMMDVHYDYDPPPPYIKMFDPDYQGSVTGEDFMNNSSINREMNPRDLEHILARYDGEIRYTDEHLGVLFDYLRQLGEWDNTVVIVTADHGDEFFEHGWKGHRESLYDEVLLVPLILRYPPRLPQGVVIASQVRLIDVAATALALVGVPDAEGLARARPPYGARDLVRVISAEAAESPRLPAFSHLSEVFTAKPGPLYSLRSDHEKFVVNTGGSVPVELYDLAADAGEQRNLAGAGHPFESQLGGVLARWRKLESTQTGGRHQMTAAEQEELKALGYLQ